MTVLDAEKWNCPWCGEVARTVRASICDSRQCECGAVGIGAPDVDWDEVTDDAIDLFQVRVRDESRGNDAALRDDLRAAGVEIREGVKETNRPGRPYQYVWFRRR
jgi:hypothetical protein